MDDARWIPAGYKRTEMGVIPEDWEVRPLDQIFDVAAGGDFDASVSSTTRDEVYRYPIYSNATSLNGLHGFCSYNDHRAGSITVTARGTLGVANYRDHDFTAIGRVLVLTPRVPVEGRFFSEFINDRVDFAIESTGVPQLTAPQISKYKLALPSLREQRAIADVLSDVDALIAALERLIAKKRAIQQGAMQQLLTGQTRLPGFSEPWEVKRLGDVAKMGSGGTPLTSVADYYGGGIPWASISDMTDTPKYLSSTERSLTEKGLENSSAKLFPKGTILFAMYASIGECSIANIPLSTSQAILGIIPSSTLSVDYLYYLLLWEKRILIAQGQQGTQSNLNKGMIEAINFDLPCIEEQRAIAEVLSDMDAEIAALEARRDKTRAIKQGMMQKLLTGRIRLV